MKGPDQQFELENQDRMFKMLLINAVIFAMCVVSGIDALKCHGAYGILVDVPEHRYTWHDSNRKFGVCYIYVSGIRGYDEAGFRGDIDYACENQTYNGVMCYCATDGCNAEMPHVGVHMTPVVNCVSLGGEAYQCGGNSGRAGNVCGTHMILDPNIPNITTTGVCIQSLGEKGCYTLLSGSTQNSYCVGNGITANY